MNRSEDIADAHVQASNSILHLVGGGRVKPDPESNPLADLDCEKEPTRVEPSSEPTRREGSTFARR